MSDHDSDKDYSLSGLTQENPTYVSVVQETSDKEDESNLSDIFECARQLAGDVPKVMVGMCEMSNSVNSIHSNILTVDTGNTNGQGTPKRMRYSEPGTVLEVCSVISLSNVI